MNYNEALQYIHSNFWQGSKPGLSRTRSLLEALGNPQNKLRFIHVAGTNGKGSFCAMLSSILIREGYKIGTYTSPYILRFNERMKINGIDIPDETLSELTEYVRPYAEAMQEKPTEFELITAIAMEYFAREECDLVVLECGMGGRLDSTNVIETPVLSVITGIALDHTAFLGNTIEAIATEKAGIIKEGIPCLYCGNDLAAKQVIEQIAIERSAPFYTVDRGGMTIKQETLKGTVFDWHTWQDIQLPLLGTYQKENAQNVLNAVLILNNLGISVSETSVKDGLSLVCWPARYEIVSKSPLIICDGGHNPEGVDSAVKSTKHYFQNSKLLIITGVMKDKDYDYMVSRLSEIAKKVFCLTPANPRSLSGEDLAKEFQFRNIPAYSFETPLHAVDAAIKESIESKTPILCVGSLYMYGEIIHALETLHIR